ncbi:hypothetical protein V5O48_011709, partial [Marasmius crinis-equi]
RNVADLPSWALGTLTGQAALHNVGTAACSTTSSNSDFVVALSDAVFDAWPGAGANPDENPICNKHIQVSYQGKTIELTIVDRCAECAFYDLGLTPAAFSKFEDGILQDRDDDTSLLSGRTGISWVFV